VWRSESSAGAARTSDPVIQPSPLPISRSKSSCWQNGRATARSIDTNRLPTPTMIDPTIGKCDTLSKHLDDQYSVGNQSVQSEPFARRFEEEA
jgi:hypothetical protein